MKKFINLLLAVSLIISLFLLTSCQTEVIELGDDFITNIYNQALENGQIDFSQFTDFEWDRLIVIAPYSTVDAVLESTNTKWQNPATSVEYSDVQTLLLFIKDNLVAGYVNFPRDKIDFSQIAPDLSYSKSDAIFNVSADQLYSPSKSGNSTVSG